MEIEKLEILKEKLVIGSEWVCDDSTIVQKILFVGEKALVYSGKLYRPKPKEPKKSGRLFMCLHSGEIKCIDGVNWKKTSMGDVPVTINEKGEVFEVIE
jgi:hypothetical protein